MLRRPTAEEAEEYIDYAYKLALDPKRSGYPTYTDGIKTKEDFVEVCHYAFTREDRVVLFYLENNIVSGWIQFILEEEERYLETNVFNIGGDIRKALKEFVEYCAAHYGDYSICMGFPRDNQSAVSYLSEIGWCCEEESYNNVLLFEQYELMPEETNVVKVTKRNYEDFRTLHEPVEGNMYWNSERLYKNLEDWDLYVYYKEGAPAAAIYNRDSGTLMHIYGVDYKNNIYDPMAFRALMTAVLNDCKRNGKNCMVFFGEDQNQDDTLSLGYTCVGEYVLFSKRV